MSNESESMPTRWRKETHNHLTIDPRKLENSHGRGKAMRHHLHHVQHMTNHLPNEYLSNPQMDIIQPQQHLNTLDILHMPRMNPGTAPRPNPLQFQ